MSKKEKIPVKDEVFDPTALTTTQSHIEAINNHNETPLNDRSALNLTVNADLILAFEVLLNNFKQKTKAYFTYNGKTQLFVTGCRFIKHQQQEQGIFEKAPAAFIQMITRKGRRPQSEQQYIRKGNPKVMYLNLDTDTYHSYFDIMYSFLKARSEQGSNVYSTSYFFKDFLDTLQNDFNALCAYEKAFPLS